MNTDTCVRAPRHAFASVRGELAGGGCCDGAKNPYSEYQRPVISSGLRLLDVWCRHPVDERSRGSTHLSLPANTRKAALEIVGFPEDLDDVETAAVGERPAWSW